MRNTATLLDVQIIMFKWIVSLLSSTFPPIPEYNTSQTQRALVRVKAMSLVLTASFRVGRTNQFAGNPDEHTSPAQVCVVDRLCSTCVWIIWSLPYRLACPLARCKLMDFASRDNSLWKNTMANSANAYAASHISHFCWGDKPFIIVPRNFITFLGCQVCLIPSNESSSALVCRPLRHCEETQWIWIGLLVQ